MDAWDRCSVRLTSKKRFWFRPAFKVLWAICVCTELVSSRLADFMTDVGCTFLAHHGFKRESQLQDPLRKIDPADPSR